MKEERFLISLRRWLRRDFDTFTAAAREIGVTNQQITDCLHKRVPVPPAILSHYGYVREKEVHYRKGVE